MIRVFDNAGEDFSAFWAAKAWCVDHGFVVGGLQRGSAVGVMSSRKCYVVSKWRGMTAKEKSSLDARITFGVAGSREGSATIHFSPWMASEIGPVLAAEEGS